MSDGAIAQTFTIALSVNPPLALLRVQTVQEWTEIFETDSLKSKILRSWRLVLELLTWLAYFTCDT